MRSALPSGGLEELEEGAAAEGVVVVVAEAAQQGTLAEPMMAPLEQRTVTEVMVAAPLALPASATVLQ